MEDQGDTIAPSADVQKFLVGEDGKAYDQPRPKWQAAPPKTDDECQAEEDGGSLKRQRIGDFLPPPPPLAAAAGMPEDFGSSKSCWPMGKGKFGAPPMAFPGAFGKGFAKNTFLPPRANMFPNGFTTPMFPTTSLPQMPPEGMALGDRPPIDRPVPVFLARATANIVPVSSKTSADKTLALQFIQSPREMQQQMLRDPAVARAIMQTLSDSPQTQGGSPAPMLASLGGSAMMPPPLAPAPPANFMMALPPSVPQGTSWSGVITLARNKGKRLQMRSALLHGKVQDVEVALRCAATTFGALDITHRVPFEEVAKRAPTGTLLSMAPTSPAELVQYEEYAKYFRSKMRAGVAKLDAELSLYVLPPTDDVLVLRDSVYALNPGITPRSNCLLGLIASTTEQLRASTPAAVAPRSSTLALPVATVPAPAPDPAPEALPPPPPPPAQKEVPAAPPVAKEEASSTLAPEAEDQLAKADGEKASLDGGTDVSQKEILDLFSNPELIKLLSDDAAQPDA
mmetsp:Transcript_83842/g.130885  ORF Transcript_83842/g.130885 Transcript_83842/m.130885 type:complete len:511 (+) Transcript_83842:92-1624(+)